MSARKLPLQPLLDAAGVTKRTLRTRVRTFHANVERAERQGLSTVVADRWACALDLHPVEVWGTEWVDA